ncbi:PEPxxWA-CTERM sorting domain-containing protein [Phenylobacterium sp.]|uniref:PEPxxWA-CTERM sorting domain-containing protein n=1 Tax=Phenylobacterium sp. TaxID=1871053 RepID=UPI0025E0A86A|nr:PEPxxWA-CTERM sorting domain-containing protein [Phenylobacterium sp.]
MRRILLMTGLAVASGFLILAPVAAQAAITLDFEGVDTNPPSQQPIVYLGDFYNGGSSTLGTVGVDHGVTFGNKGALVCLNTTSNFCSNVSRGGQGDPASQAGGLAFYDDDSFINFADGFDTQLSFVYAALGFGTGSGGIYDGEKGTGNLLASFTLPVLAPGCGPAYGSASFCPFEELQVSFAGTAKSIWFTGVTGYVVFDDITVGGGSAAPEPATWALMIAGFGLAGLRMRRRAAVRS